MRHLHEAGKCAHVEHVEEDDGVAAAGGAAAKRVMDAPAGPKPVEPVREAVRWRRCACCRVICDEGRDGAGADHDDPDNGEPPASHAHAGHA